ncbi:MAG: copper homeostasis protein CutC [Bacteroidota bacterium]
MIIEICANGFESAQVAQNTGAQRIELCTNLSVGGLTPTHEEVEKVMSQLTIPVHVLIRPRGGDFCYSESEVETMLSDIAYCKQLGCAGVVSGVLNSEGKIDVTTTTQLIAASKGMEFTFHRAFDVCTDWEQGLHFLLSSGVTRLLSSGQQSKAIEGIELLKTLKERARNKLQIMPGGGINTQNVVAFKEAGFQMIHFSATQKNSHRSEGEEMFSTETIGHSSQQVIENIMTLLA